MLLLLVDAMKEIGINCTRAKTVQQINRSKWLWRFHCWWPHTLLPKLHVHRPRACAPRIFPPQKSRLVPCTERRMDWHPSSCVEAPPPSECLEWNRYQVPSFGIPNQRGPQMLWHVYRHDAFLCHRLHCIQTRSWHEVAARRVYRRRAQRRRWVKR